MTRSHRRFRAEQGKHAFRASLLADMPWELELGCFGLQTAAEWRLNELKARLSVRLALWFDFIPTRV
jgi:hypothetical protein